MRVLTTARDGRRFVVGNKKALSGGEPLRADHILTAGGGRCMARPVYLSLRFKRKLKSHQRDRWALLNAVNQGPAKIALLIKFATDVEYYGHHIWRPDTSQRRRIFNADKQSWIGDAGIGHCRACGHGPRLRCWHHILPLCAGGSNSAKNRIRVCEECHAQIHMHLSAPPDTDDALYRQSRALIASGMERLSPRLVKKVVN